MAYIIHCSTCGQQTAHSTRSGCLVCAERKARESKEAHLNARAGMSIEDRITLLESELYDFNNRPWGPVVYG